MFVQVIQGPCSRRTELRELVDSWCGDIAGVSGWLGGTYGFTDDGRFVGIGRFTDGMACVAAARRRSGRLRSTCSTVRSTSTSQTTSR